MRNVSPSLRDLIDYSHVYIGSSHISVLIDSVYSMYKNLHGYTLHQRQQMFYCPTDALEYIKPLKCYKPIKLIKAAPTCFGSRRNHDQGATASKRKAVPLQVWSGPECSRKLEFPHFMTTTQDGGKVVSLTHRPPLPPGNVPGTHFC